ncbi:hypothetical protein L3V82_11645 [Thiotrichales bacterium 19S3-7]|nr:hypothetical protein [Thiotrichales bacterium 19S3-7]MCF6802866.1 hypothetical protein [Thiotrichales bacterium 19S3-11]
MLNIAVESLIPHRKPMCLIDRVLQADSQQVICQSDITQSHLFYRQAIGGVDHWVAIEMMAQASGILARFQAGRSLDEKPRLGFLLSIRNYKAYTDYFTEDTCLTIIASKIYIEESLGAFDCQVRIDDTSLASAKINAVEPDEQMRNEIIQG